MASGKFYDGKEQKNELFWTASDLARQLVLRGFPGNRYARIKLCLCHSAQEFKEGRFAQNLARAWRRHGSPPRLHGYDHGAHTFEHVYVGGFGVPVNWTNVKANQNDKLEKASRIYFRCDGNGILVNKYALPRIADQEQVWCYFPFNFLEGVF
jgi:hypothetical protein